ncbi:MAG TPA: zinc-binding dehydrogenase [Acidimicrobiia bacterium]|nr:zinc-binding dehydrogenase [Acidimicrobiia bacterium]
MRTFAIAAYGSPLVEVDAPDPEPGPGELVVRVDAAGICRSDVHYRAGTRPVPSLPLVPGHEVAGTVTAVGEAVESPSIGDRVCLHYLVSCGVCTQCRRGAEQFCEVGEMVGLDRQGGYAEAIVVPARNAHPIPDGVDTTVAAVMMCSTATSLHALRRAGVAEGSRVAVFGAGGLGMSALRLARVLGAVDVFAVDINPVKLGMAADLGATPLDADGAVAALRAGGGVDIALELVGSPDVMRAALDSLAVSGRAVAVGLTHREMSLNPYRDLVTREAEIVGSADHLSSEIDELLTWAADGTLDLDGVITRRIPFDLDQVNAALDRLEEFGDDVRVAIEP